jgi:hypothetical protein
VAAEAQQDEGIACSLGTVELATRHRDAAALFADGLTAADHYGDTLELRFRERYEPRVQALAAAERDCCPFMDIEVHREGRDILLTLDCPPEAATTLDPFAELAARTLATRAA